MNETLATPAAPILERRRFTADEFDRMVETGILAEAERVELIDGEIIRMRPNRWESRRMCQPAHPRRKPTAELG